MSLSLTTYFWDGLSEFSEHVMIHLGKWGKNPDMKINLNFLFITGIAFTDLPVREVHFQTAFLHIVNRCFSCNLCLPYVSWKYCDNHLNQFNIINFSSPFKWWFVNESQIFFVFKLIFTGVFLLRFWQALLMEV